MFIWSLCLLYLNGCSVRKNVGKYETFKHIKVLLMILRRSKQAFTQTNALTRTITTLKHFETKINLFANNYKSQIVYSLKNQAYGWLKKLRIYMYRTLTCPVRIKWLQWSNLFTFIYKIYFHFYFQISIIPIRM